jgi:hypothetical protein
MEGAQNGYGSYFSPANFGDCDDNNKGLIGEFSGSQDYVSLAKIMENLSVCVVNLIEEDLVNKSNIITDENVNADINRSKNTYMTIKNKLISMGCAGHLEQIQKFLKPVDEQVSYSKIKNLADTLKVENFNGFSKDFFSELVLDVSGTDFFKDEFGTDLETFSATLKKVCNAYDSAYFNLFESDADFIKNVGKFSDLAKQLNTILALEVNEASSAVLGSITQYLNEFFKKQNLKEKFDNFILARKRFSIIRNILMVSKKTIEKTDESTEPPPCTICVSDPVKMAFVPCGHTFCLSCATKNINTCYICRTKITSKLKLYYV